MSGILVLAEHRHGELREVSSEVLSAARGLAGQTGAEVEAVLLGQGCAEMAQQLASQAHRVIHAEHGAFKDFNSEAYQRALVQLVKERQPSVVMIPHTAFGTDLAPGLAVELGVGIVSDAIGFEPGADGLKVTRGVYGGKLNAERTIRTTPALVMVRQSHFKPGQPGLEAEVVNWDPGDVDSGLKTRFISLEEVPSTGIDITKADVVIGIGRGIKEEKNIEPIREFADSIGAVLAGSRPVIDAGWLEKERQVGSSGKTVKPKVYIALGISGAFQHVAGMTGSDTIIAVNKDPHAPIFAVAHYGIVDDLHKVVPALKEKLA